MSLEINRFVVQAIVEMAVFIEFSGEAILNPDAAIQVLEQLASTLQMADSETMHALCLQFESISGTYSGEQAEFVAGLGEALGLTEE